MVAVRAIVPVGNNTLYAGAVSGGLWKSTNRGDNWTQMLSFPSLMVGSMTIFGSGHVRGNGFTLRRHRQWGGRF